MCHTQTKVRKGCAIHKTKYARMWHTQSKVRKGCAMHKAKYARDVSYTKKSTQGMCHTQSKVHKRCVIYKAKYARCVPHTKQGTQGICHTQRKVGKGCATPQTKKVNVHLPSLMMNAPDHLCLGRHIYMSHVLLLCISFLRILVVLY
jgi:hypothetical protein